MVEIKTKTFRNFLTKDVSVPKQGGLLKGKIIEIGKNSIFVDLGTWGTGVIVPRELRENRELFRELELGQEVSVVVVEPENEAGFVELSLKEAAIKEAWQDLKKKRESGYLVSVKVYKANQGGLVLEYNGLAGFLPVSQLSPENYPRVSPNQRQKIVTHLNRFVNKQMQVKIIDFDEKTQSFVASEKAIEEEKIRQALQSYKVGDVIEGVVSGVVDFGAFIKFPARQRPEPARFESRSESGGPQALAGGPTSPATRLAETRRKQGEPISPGKLPSSKDKDLLEGLIHISELDWEIIEDPKKILKPGDKVKVKIINIKDSQVSLSLKALKKDPWEDIEEKYKKGDQVQAKVVKLNPFGAFVQLDKKIQGLTHISEFGTEEKMKEALKLGKKYQFKILSFEPKLHKMSLGLVKS